VLPAAAFDDSSDPFRFFRTGGKRIVNFTVTNHCNASCVYCSFHTQKNKKTVTLEQARRAIDYLVGIGTGMVSLTGGEPLLNPDLPGIVRYAREKGLIVLSGTNGVILTRETARELKSAGLNALWISYESNSPKDFEKNRGVPGLHEKVRTGVKALRECGLPFFAIALINRSITDIPAFVSHLLGMGFPTVKFDYPMSFPLESTYLGWSRSPLLEMAGPKMSAFIDGILAEKKKGRINVLNPTGGLLDARRFYNGGRTRYPCYSGDRILYLDADLDLYRCPALGDRLGRVGGKFSPGRIDCDRCYYQGARDFGPFYYLLETLDLGRPSVLAGLPARMNGALLRAARDAVEIRRSGIP
jgi:MoaA/NifB/PqqE/SkfB family radical SAM enzyme